MIKYLLMLVSLLAYGSLWSQSTQTKDYSFIKGMLIQEYVIHECCDSIRIITRGGDGGSNPRSGAIVSATFTTVTPGDRLDVVVGEMSKNYNSGGGGTAVIPQGVTSMPDVNGDIFIVAGGGPGFSGAGRGTQRGGGEGGRQGAVFFNVNSPADLLSITSNAFTNGIGSGALGSVGRPGSASSTSPTDSRSDGGFGFGAGGGGGGKASTLVQGGYSPYKDGAPGNGGDGYTTTTFSHTGGVGFGYGGEGGDTIIIPRVQVVLPTPSSPGSTTIVGRDTILGGGGGGGGYGGGAGGDAGYGGGGGGSYISLFGSTDTSYVHSNSRRTTGPSGHGSVRIIAYTSNCNQNAENIPTLSTWSLIILLLMIATVGVVMIKYHKPITQVAK